MCSYTSLRLGRDALQFSANTFNLINEMRQTRVVNHPDHKTTTNGVRRPTYEPGSLLLVKTVLIGQREIIYLIHTYSRARSAHYTTKTLYISHTHTLPKHYTLTTSTFPTHTLPKHYIQQYLCSTYTVTTQTH